MGNVSRVRNVHVNDFLMDLPLYSGTCVLLTAIQDVDAGAD